MGGFYDIVPGLFWWRWHILRNFRNLITEHNLFWEGFTDEKNFSAAQHQKKAGDGFFGPLLVAFGTSNPS